MSTKLFSRFSKCASILLAITLATTTAIPVVADLESELREEVAWTSSKLEGIYAELDELYYAKQELAYQESVISEELYNVMVSIELVQRDIANKQEEIKKTENDLEKANNARDKQYSSMKQRIQYIYEKGGDDMWFQMLLNADSVADLLTKAEYTQAMYESDRKALTKFANTIEEVKKLESKYTLEKGQLEGLEQEYQEASWELEYQLDVTRENQADCEDEIAWAQYQAQEYADWLVYATAEIERLEAERIAAEEAARRAAEEEAARRAAEAAAEAASMVSLADVPEEFITAEGAIDEDYLAEVAESLTVYDEDGNAISAVEAAESGKKVYDSDGDAVDATAVVSSVSSSSGSAIVDFAKQFVGNPYVWGGTSLTNGADCSGFVQSVYGNFGISLPRTSYEQETAGYEVSYADIQPGDLVCYGSHVAIYIGDGQIVHASNEAEGIKISNNAAYRTITSVRRLV